MIEIINKAKKPEAGPATASSTPAIPNSQFESTANGSVNPTLTKLVGKKVDNNSVAYPTAMPETTIIKKMSMGHSLVCDFGLLYPKLCDDSVGAAKRNKLIYFAS
jgi:hypothetical protein